MSNSVANRRSALDWFAVQPAPGLCDCILAGPCTRPESRGIEEAYLHWNRPFLLFRNRTDARGRAGIDINGFDATGSRRKGERVHSAVHAVPFAVRARRRTAAEPIRSPPRPKLRANAGRVERAEQR